MNSTFQLLFTAFVFLGAMFYTYKGIVTSIYGLMLSVKLYDGDSKAAISGTSALYACILWTVFAATRGYFG